MRRYDPMMEPNFYHFWREKFREHGLEGAGDYWYDGRETPLTFAGACQLVAMRELPETVMVPLRTLSRAFLDMARRLGPEIQKFNEDLAEAGLVDVNALGQRKGSR